MKRRLATPCVLWTHVYCYFALLRVLFLSCFLSLSLFLLFVTSSVNFYFHSSALCFLPWFVYFIFHLRRFLLVVFFPVRLIMNDEICFNLFRDCVPVNRLVRFWDCTRLSTHFNERRVELNMLSSISFISVQSNYVCRCRSWRGQQSTHKSESSNRSAINNIYVCNLLRVFGAFFTGAVQRKSDLATFFNSNFQCGFTRHCKIHFDIGFISGFLHNHFHIYDEKSNIDVTSLVPIQRNDE